MLSNINTEETKRDFTKMESQLLVTKTVNDNLVEQNRILERNCAVNEQYFR